MWNCLEYVKKKQDSMGKVEMWDSPGYSGENMAQPELCGEKLKIACAKRREKLDSLASWWKKWSSLRYKEGYLGQPVLSGEKCRTACDMWSETETTWAT